MTRQTTSAAGPITHEPIDLDTDYAPAWANVAYVERGASPHLHHNHKCDIHDVRWHADVPCWLCEGEE